MVFFFSKFGNKKECDKGLQGAPWLFVGRLIILKKWNKSISLERDLLSSIPIWVRFPSLHLKSFTENIKAASLIGRPLYGQCHWYRGKASIC